MVNNDSQNIFHYGKLPRKHQTNTLPIWYDIISVNQINKTDSREEYIPLSEDERILLEKRGFYVKKKVNSLGVTLGILGFIFTGIITIFVLLFFGVLVTGIWIEGYHSITILILVSILCGLIFLRLGKFLFLDLKTQYIKLRNSLYIGMLFFIKDGLIAFQDKYLKLEGEYYSSIGGKIDNIYPTHGIKDIIPKAGLYLLGLIGLSIIIQFYDISLGLYYLIGFLIPVAIYLIISSIFRFFHYRCHLYSFGNLGYKVQSLTPRISKQSKQIEGEFRGDMDFRVLSKSFDSLASTFSQIVILVMRLEKAEKRANKGDLFDSTKYINSLREDIRTPLISLKTFLETKKVELETSQQELMRVRVSAGGESENRVLQSIRSNELLKELDENIVKIGGMIERL